MSNLNPYNKDFINKVKIALNYYTIKTYPLHEKHANMRFAHAAVLIPFYYTDGEWHIIFTARSNDLPTHKGQISFPGGKVDKTDEDIYHTAKRETFEEVGIKPDDVKIIGRISAYPTPSGFMIYPVVGIISRYIENLSQAEVKFVLKVPVKHLLNYSNMEIVMWNRNGIQYPLPFFYYKGHKIWGATGLILKDFLDHIKSFNKYFT